MNRHTGQEWISTRTPPSSRSAGTTSSKVRDMSIFSAWQFISAPHSGQGSLLLSVNRDVLPSVSQHFRHPDELLAELLHPTDVSRLEKLAGGRVEGLPDVRNVPVPEDRDEPELPHHRQEILDDARSAPRSARHSDDSDRLVDVLLEVRVEDVLQEAGVAVVVLGGHDHERVRPHHRNGKGGTLDLLSRVVRGERQRPDVEELGLDAGKPRDL